MKYLKKYELFEKKKRNSEEEKKFTGDNRIILLGPPTVGKSTVSKALGEKLGLEVLSLDKLNHEVIKDYSDKGKIKTVETSLSKTYNDFILDFGGGHVYFGNVKDLLKGYKNVFVLIPSEDYDLSDKILREHSRNKDMRKMINHILKSIESPSCEFSDAKKEKLIKIVKKIHSGGKGELKASEIPKASLDKFGDSLKDGFESSPDWDIYCNFYTKKHDKINRSITDNIIEVFTDKGNRRLLSSIVNEIIKKCK
jgi:adenylate kinase family enzyme